MPRWGERPRRMAGETARRITGVSTALGGVQWADPGPSQRERARAFLLFLEDRRVLYNPMWLEVAEQVERSLDEIRQECTDALRKFGETDYAVVPLRAIRAACRRFRDDAATDFPHMGWGAGRGEGSAGFFLALGAMRAIIGQQVAALVAHYDLEVEGDLATVLPRDNGDGAPDTE